MDTVGLEQEPVIDVAGTPETIDRILQLQEFFTMPDELVEKYRPQLWTAAERILGLIPDTSIQQQALQVVGAIDYCYFGHPGDPIPPGVVRTISEDGIEDISWDYRLPHLRADEHRLKDAIEGAGFEQAAREISKYGQQVREQAKDNLTDLLTSSSEYELLRSFDEPPVTPIDTPPTPYWRQLREGQLEQALRTKHGYNENEAIPLDDPFHFDLRRAVHRLDLETERRDVTAPAESSAKGLQRARDYLLPFLIDAVNKDEAKAGYKYEYKSIIHPEDDSVCVVIVDATGNERELELYEYAKEAAADFISNMYSGEPALRVMVKQFMANAIEDILDPNQTAPLQEVLDGIVESTVTYAGDCLQDIWTDRFSNLRYGDGHFSLVRKPRGEVLDSERLTALRYEQGWTLGPWRELFGDRADLSTRSELLRSENTEEGRVLKYGPANYREATRLIYTTERSEPVQAYTDDADLVLSYTFPFNRRTVPAVPGYKLVWASPLGDQFGFVADKLGDPYQPCKVLLNQQRRSQLATAYADIGLPELAEQVANWSRMTVADLTGLIRRHSIYFLPETTRRRGTKDSTVPEDHTDINSFKDFAKLVQDGRLQVQCTGSALFLKQSLVMVFGQDCSAVTTGEVLPSHSATITATRHAQTVFAHRGRQYILDSQPASDALSHSANEEFAETYTKKSHAPRTPHLSLADHQSEAVVPSAEALESPPLDKQLSTLTNSVSERLRVAFDLPDEKSLVKYLVRLPKKDPARRTMELLVQFADDRLDTRQVKELGNYIIACSGASAETKRRLGFDNYSSGLLSELSHTVWRLEFMIKDALSR